MTRKKDNPLRKTYKKLKFWYKALLETDLMNDPNDRKEFQECLSQVKNHSKQE